MKETINVAKFFFLFITKKERTPVLQWSACLHKNSTTNKKVFQGYNYTLWANHNWLFQCIVVEPSYLSLSLFGFLPFLCSFCISFLKYLVISTPIKCYRNVSFLNYINKNVNVDVYSLIALWVQQTLQFTTLVLKISLIRSYLLWGNYVHFLQLMPFTIFQFFVPSGIHHCWVGRGTMEWEVCPTLLHMTTSGNWTPDLLILHPAPYPLDHMLP